MRYIALLRGINVGGNNKVTMSDLRDCFEKDGFRDVSTYINSGNILFSSDLGDVTALIQRCEMLIEKRFGFPVVVAIVAADDFIQMVDNAPKWWATDDPKEFRNEALFVIPPTTADEVLKEIQTRTSTVDKFMAHKQVVFWTLPRISYTKSVVPKIIGTPIYRRITIRSSATTKKLYDLIGDYR